MKKAIPEPYRDIDFSQANRGPVVKPEPGKTKISIFLDKTVIESFRALADQAGGGNYQTLINDALVAYLHQRETQHETQGSRGSIRGCLAAMRNNAIEGPSGCRRWIRGPMSMAIYRLASDYGLRQTLFGPGAEGGFTRDVQP